VSGGVRRTRRNASVWTRPATRAQGRLARAVAGADQATRASSAPGWSSRPSRRSRRTGRHPQAAGLLRRIAKARVIRRVSTAGWRRGQLLRGLGGAPHKAAPIPRPRRASSTASGPRRSAGRAARQQRAEPYGTDDAMIVSAISGALRRRRLRSRSNSLRCAPPRVLRQAVARARDVVEGLVPDCDHGHILPRACAAALSVQSVTEGSRLRPAPDSFSLPGFRGGEELS